MPEGQMGPTRIDAADVVGVGAGEVVIAGSVRLHARAAAITRVAADVRLDRWRIDRDTVLIHGTVCKRVVYDREDGRADSDRFQLPFDCRLDVPGAAGGDRFEPGSSHVRAQRDELVSPPADTLIEKLRVTVSGRVTRETPAAIPPVPAGDRPGTP